jgi:outer membrane protein OmpA-like peptidoglycan-associated protein
MKLIAAAVISLLSGPAFAQGTTTPSPSTEHTVPIFRVTVVGRTTAAINYRPHKGSTTVDLIGTAMMPEARGSAVVAGKDGHIQIDARVMNLQRATRFGSEYLTYVLWAITPEGRPRNLGELRLQDKEIRKQVTTELQAFALIVTAEPYFAVSQPSDIVVMENVVRDGTQGNVETVQAKYELLPRGSYLMNRSTDFRAKPLEPGASLDLAEARNAIELARLAGADRYATDTFTKAARLLATADIAREQRKSSNEIMMAARQAAQTAEDARLISLKRQEDEYTARQRTLAAQRELEALEQRRRAEAESLRAQAESQRAQVEAQRAQAEAQNAAAARDEAERQRRDAEQTQAAKDAAEAELQQARLQTLKAQAAAAVAEQEKHELRERLREQLNAFLETRETARGLIMMVPDVLFDSGSARLTGVAREKLARVSGILASHPDLHIAIEGHTDDVGSAGVNQRLSERRAESVLAYLVQQKIPLTAVDTAGFGEARPIAPNTTAEGRQENRRVELVVTGESIGRADSTSAQ